MHCNLITYDVLTSTQDEAWRLASLGEAAEGTVVLATRQTQGRGRHERVWESPAGNVHATFVLTPRVPVAALPQLALVCAVAVADAVAAYAPDAAVTLKWPNDVLIEGRKVAGILLESRTQGGVMTVLCGVGINLATAPEGTLWPAVALSEYVVPPSASEMAHSVWQRLLPLYQQWQEEGAAPVLARWRARSFAVAGQETSVRLPDRTLSGAFCGVDETGALVLQLADGEKTTIHAGDVFF